MYTPPADVNQAVSNLQNGTPQTPQQPQQAGQPQQPGGEPMDPNAQQGGMNGDLDMGDDLGMGDMGNEGAGDDLGGNMGEDPTMDNSGAGEIGEEMPEDGMGDEADNDGDSMIDQDSTANILNKLTPEQIKAVRSYAESMIKNGDSDNEPEVEDEEPTMTNESFIFTKKQLKELNERLRDGLDGGRTQKTIKKDKKMNKKSPFNSPKFK